MREASGAGPRRDSMSNVDHGIDELYLDFDLDRLRLLDHHLRQLPDGAIEAEDFERMYRLCVLYAHHAALPGDGLPVANKWARCARARDALPQLRKALTVRAALRRMSGDMSGAMEDNIEAYEISVDVGDRTSSAAVLSNLANLLGRLELDRAAIQLAERAIQLVSKEVPKSDLAERTRYISLSIIADRLLWSDPARALRVSAEAERAMPTETASFDPVHKTIIQVVGVTTLCNQLVAALNVRDRALALSVGSRLRCAVESSSKNYSRSAALVILGALEAWYGDQNLGISTLRQACLTEAGGDAWQDATKLLVDLCEERGLEEEGLNVLRSYYVRLQAARRTVAIEELRRIAAESDAGEPGEAEDDPIGRRLAAFQVSVAGLNERLTAKLLHLEGIALAAEVREGAEMNRAEHIYRVGQLCSELAAAWGCSRETQWLAEIAGRLHDIGKCAVPDTVLLSAGPLPAPIRAIVREHSDYGARLVADADEPRLVQAVAAVRHHHERFDGSGYPSGLKGEEIPLLARMVALAESFDAMLQSRPYRSSRTVGKSLEEIERCAGTQFDPTLAGTFVRLVRQIQREHGDVLDYLGRQACTNPRVRTFERLERLMANSRGTL
jgi:HD-GYP domain-containing protein (c-di-GMP phosphodiesterase class II)